MTRKKGPEFEIGSGNVFADLEGLTTPMSFSRARSLGTPSV
jgi:hypothetical protein